MNKPMALFAAVILFFVGAHYYAMEGQEQIHNYYRAEKAGAAQGTVDLRAAAMPSERHGFHRPRAHTQQMLIWLFIGAIVIATSPHWTAWMAWKTQKMRALYIDDLAIRIVEREKLEKELVRKEQERAGILPSKN